MDRVEIAEAMTEIETSDFVFYFYDFHISD